MSRPRTPEREPSSVDRAAARAREALAPVWESQNRRFEELSRCPYPDCGAPVQRVGRDAVDRCPTCGNVHEIAVLAVEGRRRVVRRRPDALHCPQTGEHLAGRSPLDWAEHGGGPGRTFATRDPETRIFGRPDPDRCVWLPPAPEWTCPVRPDGGDEREVPRALALVRERLLAVTNRGTLVVIDARSGAAVKDGRFAWPDGVLQAHRGERVDATPAVRGGTLVVQATHQAQFRPVAPVLDPQRHGAFRAERVERGPRVVDAGAGRSFLAAPLTIDGALMGPGFGPESPVFCLLSGVLKQAERTRRDLREARLEIFRHDGRRLAEVAVEGIALPPVLDSAKGLLLWVDGEGSLGHVALADLAAGGEIAPRWHRNRRPATLDLSERSLLVATLDSHGDSELWTVGRGRGDGNHGGAGGVVLLHVPLHKVLGGKATEGKAPEGDSFEWRPAPLALNERLEGLAVGLGGVGGSTASDQLAVTTGRLAASLDRLNPGDAGTTPVGHGSLEPPVLCGAGMVVRGEGRVTLDSQRLGWCSASRQTHGEVGGRYDDFDAARGLLVSGRRVYVGCAAGVARFTIQVESEDTWRGTGRTS